MARKSLDKYIATLSEILTRPQKYALITVGIVLATVFLAMNMVVNPWKTQRAALQARYAEEQQRVKLLSQISQQDKRLISKEKEVLFAGGAPELASEVSKIARQMGLEIESVTPQEGTAFETYKRLEIEVLAVANFRDLVAFLQTLERHEPPISVNSLEVSGALKDQGTITSRRQTYRRDRELPRNEVEPIKLTPQVEAGLEQDRWKTRFVISTFQKTEKSS